MIRINLLPIRHTRKLQAVRLELSLALFGGVLVVLLAAGTWGLFTWQLMATRAENTAIQVEIDRLAADVAKVDEMEKFKVELERKLAVIQDLRDKKAGPVHLIDELGSAAPGKLSITRVEAAEDELRVSGFSVSNDVISQFLRALDDSPYFEQVNLQDIEAMAAKESLGLTLKSFKLTARLVTPSRGVSPAAVREAPGVPAAPDTPPLPGGDE